jgi:hypothetical protein
MSGPPGTAVPAWIETEIETGTQTESEGMCAADHPVEVNWIRSAALCVAGRTTETTVGTVTQGTVIAVIVAIEVDMVIVMATRKGDAAIAETGEVETGEAEIVLVMTEEKETVLRWCLHHQWIQGFVDHQDLRKTISAVSVAKMMTRNYLREGANHHVVKEKS